MKYLVLGAGAQGSAAAFDLLRREETEKVFLADLSISNPKPFLKPYLGGKLEMVKLDASDTEEVRKVMAGKDAVLCALVYTLNYDMTELAIEAGAHFCDLGGNTEIVERQKTLADAAKAKGVSVIPDCGLAPGMVNILAQAGIDRMDETERVRIYVGGLPQNPKPPLNYQVVYSMHGVLDYYTTLSIVLEDGKIVEKKALSEIEHVDFEEPIGTLEAFHTAGGISSMPIRYEGKIPHMVYKTLRYPGHAKIMEAVRDLGLIDLEPVDTAHGEVIPRQVFIDLVSPKLINPNGNDLVALRVIVEGTKDGSPKTVTFDLVDRYDAENGVTAMERTTGYSLATTAVMQADGRVGESGVFTPDEIMPADAYIAELAKYGVNIIES